MYFLLPIVWNFSILPETVQIVLMLNPFYYIIAEPNCYEHNIHSNGLVSAEDASVYTENDMVYNIKSLALRWAFIYGA